MRLDDPNVIDYLGLEKEKDVVVAFLVDEYDWDDEAHHLSLLQAKLNRYFDFIESGEIYGQLAETTGYKVPSTTPVRIAVLAKYEPRGEGPRFLEYVAGIAREAGIEFSLEVAPTEER